MLHDGADHVKKDPKLGVNYKNHVNTCKAVCAAQYNFNLLFINF